MHSSDWSSDVCSSDLHPAATKPGVAGPSLAAPPLKRRGYLYPLPTPKLPHLQSAESSLSMKIARFWQDTDVTWMAVPRRMAARRLFDLVGRADFGIEAPFVAPRIEHRRPVDDPRDRQSVASGKSVSARVDLGGRHNIIQHISN